MPESENKSLLTRGRKSAWQALMRIAAGFSAGGRLAVLTFHSVLPGPDPLRPGEICREDFATLMAFITERFNVVPLADALAQLRSNARASHAVAVTFDDGYRDNREVALPILKDLGIPATFFVATGFLDGGRMWNDTVIEAVRRFPGDKIVLESLGESPMSIASQSDRLALIAQLLRALKHQRQDEREALAAEIADSAQGALPDDLMMRSDDVRALSDAGMEIGGHTVDHPILRMENPEEVRRQLLEGRARLQDLSGQEVCTFAYPNGRPGDDYGPRDVELVRAAGFKAALTTSWGSISARSDFFQLPRISVWERLRSKVGLRIVQSLRSDGKVAL